LNQSFAVHASELIGPEPSALGLAGSITGCVGAAATGAAIQFAKSKGKLKTGKSFARLGQKIHRDLQPNIDEIIAKYVGSEVPVMHILSIRKALSETATD
jgi:hypothetical protein